MSNKQTNKTNKTFDGPLSQPITKIYKFDLNDFDILINSGQSRGAIESKHLFFFSAYHQCLTLILLIASRRERESEEGDKQRWDSINYMIALINYH